MSTTGNIYSNLSTYQKYQFNMIDNYVYLHHTDTLIILPTYPETLSDSMSAAFSPVTSMSRSAPIYSYQNSGPRQITFTFKMHREMMKEVNYKSSGVNLSGMNDDYVDLMVKQIQAAALPKYNSSNKMVDPPLVSVRVGNEIFIKGVVNGAVTVDFGLPILPNGKYALVDIHFSVSEVEPYDAESVMAVGGMRGLSTDLERRIYTNATGYKNVLNQFTGSFREV